MNIDDIRALARVLQENNLAELEIEERGLKIRLRGPHPVEIQTVANVLPPAGAPAHALPASATPHSAQVESHAREVAAAPEVPAHWKTIASPMVGTFYRAPAPDADSYVQVGDTVKSDTVLCIVEAMKLMNEIKAEMSGVVRKILVENAQPVEFGQPMFLIEPA
jgi:acetyl-CoA carboxylase biotin carboxyl carrier protein